MIHTRIVTQSISAGEWFHISGSKRCLFSCSNLPRAQAIPPLCLSRPSLSVQGSTIRPVISTKNLHSGVAATLAPLQLRGDQDPAISGRLANLCSFPRAGNSEHRRSSSPYSVPGVHGELKKSSLTAQTSRWIS